MKQQVAYYKTYLESLKKSPHTIKQYCIDTEQFIKFLQENHIPLNNEINSCLPSYKEYLVNTYNSPASINRKLSSLKHFLYYLKDRNIIDTFPVELLQPVHRQLTKFDTLTSKQVEEVLNYWLQIYQLSGNPEYRWLALRNFCIVNLIVELGLKPSEVVAMKWSHIHEKDITIIDQRKNRKIVLSDSQIAWLALLKEETHQFFPRCENIDYIWLGLGNQQYEPITVKTIERVFQAISKGLGFTVTATKLRYTSIHHNVQQVYNVQLKQIYERFGYARKSVLVDRIKRLN